MNQQQDIDNKAYIIALCEEAERLHLDIAPNYQPDYIGLAFAISHEMGEQGRQIFHRFCRLSTKYDESAADKKYTECLSKNKGKITVGTIIHLCQHYGMDTQAVRQRLIRQREMLTNLRESEQSEYHTHFSPGGAGCADSPEQVESFTDTDPDPEIPLPTFGRLDLPYPLDLIHTRGQTPAQCDAMLLAAITVIGAAMDWHVRTKYSGVFQYPCLQLFVVAPSASGKGAITHTRRLAYPIHRDRLERYPQAKAEHLVSMNEWNEKIRQGKAEPEPQPPAKELFLIPGNNTGTGILQNIIDSHGNGLIFEVEADTVSTAIAGDYGHWSDTLRKAFDHDSLSYNRRTGREYRDLRSVRLGVVIRELSRKRDRSCLMTRHKGTTSRWSRKNEYDAQNAHFTQKYVNELHSKKMEKPIVQYRRDELWGARLLIQGVEELPEPPPPRPPEKSYSVNRHGRGDPLR